jgi:hypothetical protein
VRGATDFFSLFLSKWHSADGDVVSCWSQSKGTRNVVQKQTVSSQKRTMNIVATEPSHRCAASWDDEMSKSNSSSLVNQLGIHLILAKQEKSVFNSLANQLGKNRNLAKLTSPRIYVRAWIVVVIVVSCRWEGEKIKKE